MTEPGEENRVEKCDFHGEFCVLKELKTLYEVVNDKYPLLNSQSATILVKIPIHQLVKYGIADKIAF